MSLHPIVIHDLDDVMLMAIMVTGSLIIMLCLWGFVRNARHFIGKGSRG
jgi:hypothetical protein